MYLFKKIYIYNEYFVKGKDRKQEQYNKQVFGYIHEIQNKNSCST